MNILSQRLSAVRSSPSSMAGQKIRALRAEGRDIVGLTLGEPDFPTPGHIVEAAERAMRAGQTRYTDVGGTPALKAAICRKFERDNGLAYSSEQVMASNGGKQVIFNALVATLDPGDEVIIPAPYWVSYPDIARLAGARVVDIPCGSETGFKLTAARLEAAITPRTKWLVLNSPCNPSGAVYHDDELSALGEVLQRHPHVWVLCDDIYEHIVFCTQKPASLLRLVPELQARCLLVNGVSKAYAMTGWRMGFGAGPAELLKAMTKLQSQSTSNPNAIAQAAAVAALTGDQACVAEFAGHFRQRRDLMVEALREIPGLSVQVPEGAFYVFPSVQALLGEDGAVPMRDAIAFADYLLTGKGLAVLPGEAYGLPGHIRLSYAPAPEVLREGCARLKQACIELTRSAPAAKEPL